MFDCFLRSAAAMAPAFDVELVSSPVEPEADIQRALDALARAAGGGFILSPASTT